MARSAEEHRHKRQIRPILCGQGWVTCKHGVDVRWVKDWNMALPSHSAFAAFSDASFCHCSGYFLLQPKWTKSKARYNEVGITCCRLEQVSHTRIEAKESLSEAVGLDHLLTIFFASGHPLQQSHGKHLDHESGAAPWPQWRLDTAWRHWCPLEDRNQPRNTLSPHWEDINFEGGVWHKDFLVD